MKIECAHDRLVPLAELIQKRNPKNPNTHSAAQIAAIAAVFEGNGVRQALVVSNRSGLLTRGHGRLEAAELLGYEAMPVDFQDYESEQAELADMLADNHLAELADIDEAKLAQVLTELQTAGHDIGLAGFTDEEFAALTNAEEEIEESQPIPAMEMQAFEHWDYLCFMFRDIRDWLRVVQLLKVGRVNASINRKTKKIGIGRVINGKKLLERLEDPARDHVAGAGEQTPHTPVSAQSDAGSA